MAKSIGSIISKKRFLIAAILIGLFVILFMIAWGFPLISDDWYKAGRDHSFIHSIFRTGQSWANTNGRIIGNFFSNFFIGPKVLNTLVKTFTILGIIVLACKNSAMKSGNFFLLSFIYVFAIPPEIFQQVYPYTAGFYNYVPPVLLLLLYTFMVQNIFSKEKIRETRMHLLYGLLLGLATQLFVEHVTFYVVIMAAAILLWHYLKYKKISWITVSYFIGSVIGAAIMFSSPVYRNVINRSDGYRYFSTIPSEIIRIAQENYSTISKHILGGNNILLFSLTVLCLFILYKSNTKGDKKLTFLKISYSVLLILITAYFLISKVLIPGDFDMSKKNSILIDLGVYILLFFCLLSLFLYFINSTGCKNRIIFFLVSVVIITAPLFIVQPIDPRNFYTSYIFIVIIILNLFEYIVTGFKINTSFFKPLLIAGVIVIFAFHYYIFYQIGQIENKQLNYIEEQMQKKSTTILLPEYPYEHYLNEPHSKKIGFTFYYYDKNDIEFVYIPYDEWVKSK